MGAEQSSERRDRVARELSLPQISEGNRAEKKEKGNYAEKLKKKHNAKALRSKAAEE